MISSGNLNLRTTLYYYIYHILTTACVIYAFTLLVDNIYFVGTSKTNGLKGR